MVLSDSSLTERSRSVESAVRSTRMRHAESTVEWHTRYCHHPCSSRQHRGPRASCTDGIALAMLIVGDLDMDARVELEDRDAATGAFMCLAANGSVVTGFC